MSHSLIWTSGSLFEVIVILVCLSVLFVFISRIGFLKLFSFTDFV